MPLIGELSFRLLVRESNPGGALVFEGTGCLKCFRSKSGDSNKAEVILQNVACVNSHLPEVAPKSEVEIHDYPDDLYARAPAIYTPTLVSTLEVTSHSKNKTACLWADMAGTIRKEDLDKDNILRNELGADGGLFFGHARKGQLSRTGESIFPVCTDWGDPSAHDWTGSSYMLVHAIVHGQLRAEGTQENPSFRVGFPSAKICFSKAGAKSNMPLCISKVQPSVDVYKAMDKIDISWQPSTKRFAVERDQQKNNSPTVAPSDTDTAGTGVSSTAVGMGVRVAAGIAASAETNGAMANMSAVTDAEPARSSTVQRQMSKFDEGAATVAIGAVSYPEESLQLCMQQLHRTCQSLEAEREKNNLLQQENASLKAQLLAYTSK
jgi:hypothetical protein